MLKKHTKKRWWSDFILTIIILFLLAFGQAVRPCWADEHVYTLNLFAGWMTSNNWEDFIIDVDNLKFENSYLTGAALARSIHKYQDKASFEIEGQIVKHFNIQTHWEVNALVVARWEKFWWDDVLDTSVAFGLGPSFATEKPELELEINKNTSQLLIYWMLELAMGLPKHPRVAVFTRIHHRSGGFGLISNEGGSNTLVFGLKWRF